MNLFRWLTGWPDNFGEYWLAYGAALAIPFLFLSVFGWLTFLTFCR